MRKRIENLPAKRCSLTNPDCTFYLWQIFDRNSLQIWNPRIRRRVVKTRRVTTEWNDIQKPGACLNSEAGCTKRIQALFSPPSFLLREKRWGRRRRVRNDHDGTKPCMQGFLSSVLVSSFPNRKLNLRFGFFLCKSVTTSQALRASFPGRGAFFSGRSFGRGRRWWRRLRGGTGRRASDRRIRAPRSSRLPCGR